MKGLRGQPIVARDGAIGFIVDVYFDDRNWKVRYLVLDTGRPMPRRQVLVSPSYAVPGDDERIHVRLSREEVERCPELEEDKPVFLQHDMGAVTVRGDPHLRSADVVTGCAVPGVGHLRDILVDTESWTLASFVVDSGVWLPGRRSLVAPADVAGIDWIERTVALMPREVNESASRRESPRRSPAR